ncbi:MAG: molybdenum cofactor guanylyltransferase MobA [Rhodoferax sp.]|nr:molybdenum cofactor guanylyltransferase MobA [Rhodoferax sp.]
MTIPVQQITGVVLAGGRGSRMGGVDKGLQLFEGKPLALHSLERLRPQVGQIMVNANRHQADYAAWGAPVWADELPDYAGPLAGFLTALGHCATPYLVTAPCDTPHFPHDLVLRLAQAMLESDSVIAMPSTPETDADGNTRWFKQPVFCLIRQDLRADLEQFTASGGRKIDAWAARHQTAIVPFTDAQAFFNINTLAELQAAAP